MSQIVNTHACHCLPLTARFTKNCIRSGNNAPAPQAESLVESTFQPSFPIGKRLQTSHPAQLKILKAKVNAKGVRLTGIARFIGKQTVSRATFFTRRVNHIAFRSVC
jgi:hypothetical protein